jgi:hypothetical protein
MLKHCAFVSLLFCSLLCLAQTEAPKTQRAPSSAALRALDASGWSARAGALGSDSMAVFVVEVDGRGLVVRRSALSGSDELKKAADAFIGGWQFDLEQLRTVKEVKRGKPWWGTLGVCYSRAAKALFACAPEDLALTGYSPESAPRRILVPGGDGEHDLVLVRKVKGARPVWEGFARASGIEGDVVVDLLLSPDGSTKEMTTISGDAKLVPAAERALGSWRFAPVEFAGKPVEALVRFTVYLGPHI